MSVEIVGPFKSHIVLVDGRKVPYLTATPHAGGIVTLTLDDAFALDVAVADLDRVAEFVAHAIAFGLCYTGHPSAEMDGPLQRHPFPRCGELA